MSIAIVRLKYENNQLKLSNDGINWSSDCSFKTDLSPSGRIMWIPESEGLEIDNIEITANPDRICKRSPAKKGGIWMAKIKDKDSGAATYVIQFSVDGEEQPEFDPEMIIKRT